ncbi:hypothetical protein HHI36_015039 [Cryptolaemus montrouzieri]|uniref:Uncharacterized protein n=1 Tax=Cryptolaemus montrouzieri TaxID=559131 RepID=A0ABD2N4X2_9CUCU
MSRSHEEEMKHLQKLYGELMSDEDIDVADPYADCNISDEYEPSESESSNDDHKILPKKAERLKKLELNEMFPFAQGTNIQKTIEPIISNFTIEFDESEQEDDEKSVSNLNWDTIDESKLKKFDFEVEEMGMKTEYYAEYNRDPYLFFKLFITDEIIIYFDEQTNIYAQQKLAQQPTNPKTKSKPWFLTDCEEMERFLGSLFGWDY